MATTVDGFGGRRGAWTVERMSTVADPSLFCVCLALLLLAMGRRAVQWDAMRRNLEMATANDEIRESLQHTVTHQLSVNAALIQPDPKSNIKARPLNDSRQSRPQARRRQR